MSRPTPFQIMRRNRQHLQRANAEREAEQAWDQLRDQMVFKRNTGFSDTADWLLDTRDQARAAAGVGQLVFRPDPKPAPRRWFQFWRPAWQ